MLGSLAKADGRVSKAEIRFVEQLMREQLGLAQEARTLAINIFNEAKKRPTGLMRANSAKSFPKNQNNEKCC